MYVCPIFSSRLHTSLTNGRSFNDFNDQFLLFDVLPVWSLVVILTQGSDSVLIEQMTSTSLPPTDPELLRRVTDTSSSCHSKNRFSVNVFICHHYQYHWNISPPHSHACRKCRADFCIFYNSMILVTLQYYHYWISTAPILRTNCIYLVPTCPHSCG